MAPKPKHRRNILTDTVETLGDAGKQIGKDTAKGVASVVDINAFLYGPSEKTEKDPETLHKKTEKAVKEFGVDEKTKKENEEMKANHTPIDVQAMRDKHQMEDIKKRLFNYQKQETDIAVRDAAYSAGGRIETTFLPSAAMFTRGDRVSGLRGLVKAKMTRWSAARYPEYEDKISPQPYSSPFEKTTQ